MSEIASTISSERQILNLLAAYAFRNDDVDIAGLGDLFAKAVFTLDGAVARGKGEIEAMAAAIIPVGPDGRSTTSHEITNSSMEVDESSGRATAQSYWTLYHEVSGTPRQAIMAGRYNDEFALGEDRWEFTRREAIIRWRLDAPVAAEARA